MFKGALPIIAENKRNKLKGPSMIKWRDYGAQRMETTGADSVAHVVGHLPSKCETLSSNSNAAKKKKKEWKQ
jgi:hypothetical protein